MTERIPIDGAYSTEANGWVSELITLTGDTYLEVTLPSKGRLVIKKSETPDGPFQKALITPWAGPDFRIRIRHGLAYPIPAATVPAGSPSGQAAVPPASPGGPSLRPLQGDSIAASVPFVTSRYIRVVTSDTPTSIYLVNI